MHTYTLNSNYYNYFIYLKCAFWHNDKKAADEAIPPWSAPTWSQKISAIAKHIQIFISCITADNKNDKMILFDMALVVTLYSSHTPIVQNKAEGQER